MNPQTIFWVTFIILLVLIIYLDKKKYWILRDQSTADRPPFSYGRVQLAWWTLIVVSSFVTILLSKGMPTVHDSTLILLGISGGTTTMARLIDVSDEIRKAVRHQDLESENFWLDILSDEKGVSIHRFQAVVFNVVFGIWFITEVFRNLGMADINISEIMPEIEPGNLILIGLGSATYAALKSTENRTPHKKNSLKSDL